MFAALRHSNRRHSNIAICGAAAIPNGRTTGLPLLTESCGRLRPNWRARTISTRCAIARPREARCPVSEVFSRTHDPRASPDAHAHGASGARAGNRLLQLLLAPLTIPAGMHALQHDPATARDLARDVCD